MFSNDLLKFFAELERNNNREWFTANKAWYEESVLTPALEFVRSMAPRLARISKYLVADDRKSGGSMMRIYRDVRFSKDKTPYNAHIAFRFMHAKPGGLGYYLGIDPKEVMLGAGVWRPDKGPLERIRKAIVGDCKQWKKAMSAKGWEPGGESLSRPPRGFDKEHPCIDGIRRKDFVLFRKLAPTVVTKKDFADKVVAGYVTAKPQVAFLARALGLPF